MSEKELQSLKSLSVPPPSETAKQAALAAALDAFEDAPSQTQGSGAEPRPTPRSHPETRRRFMTFTRAQYAMAASLAALIIAAPIAFRIMQEPRLDTPGYDATPKQPELPVRQDADLRPKTEETVAVAPESKPAEPAPAASPSPSEGLAPTAPATGPSGDEIVDLVGRSQIGVTDAAKPKPADGLGAVGNYDTRPPNAKTTEMLEREAHEAPAKPKSEIVGGEQALTGLGDATASAAMPAFPGKLDGLVAAAPIPISPDGRRMHPSALGIGLNEAIAPEPDRQRAVGVEEFRDKFEAKEINPVKVAANEPVSTFSIDVDTASYSFVRRALNKGRLPPKASVRAEEMINYFDYAYPAAEGASAPFKPTVTVVPSPWNSGNKLVHIGIRGYELKSAERPRANLVLLVDVSGSMEPADRLPLVKNGLRMLVDELKPDDTVALVTYASGSGIALEPTKVSDKSKILSAIERLGAGGSTAGTQGIQDAYRLAEQSFDKDAVNRVILATDGDFNVGLTNQDELKGLIERKRDKGIFLSILGVGRGNYNDSLMQTLAQNGNGVAAYADTLSEARKVLVEETSSTLFPIAKDVKIQVEWNPSRVAEYRLIGYETRALKREDFNNDKVDAGDIGSGHTVTAIYEITPAGGEQRLVDDLRYAKPATAPVPQRDGGDTAAPAASNELGFLKMRFKLPKSDVSEPLGFAISDAVAKASVTEAPTDVRFSIAVAGFAEILRGSPHLKSFDLDAVQSLATAARGDDAYGLRAEFLNLVRLAKSAQP